MSRGLLHILCGCAILAAMSRKKQIPKPDASAHTGTKERALGNLARYLDNPDAPMVPTHGTRLATAKHMDIAPSKMFEDKGHKLNVIRYIGEKCAITSPPKTPEETFEYAQEYFAFCADNSVPPTISCFALWCGVTLTRYEQIARDKSDVSRGQAFSAVKEMIRAFLEIAAMDGSVNPIVFFHSNKVYYGAVEQQSVVVRHEDNSQELTDEEYNERVTMLQGEDGVFRVAD